MNILVSRDSQQVQKVTEFFDFNQIPYQPHTFFDPDLDHGRFVMPDQIHQSLAVLDHDSFCQMLEWPQGVQSMIDFCRHNRIWMFGTHDVVLMLLRGYVQQNIQRLDQEINPDSVTLFLEAEPSDRCYLSGLANIRTVTYPNWHFHAARILHGRVDKPTAKKDFMLTMTRKHGALHRSCLWRELNQRSWLLPHGHVVYHQTAQQAWLGQEPTQHSWRCGFPSMDLYRDSFFEVVPESLYKYVYYFTEKTAKPMATKTPFLMLSNRGYLRYLRNMGFRTFGSVIDEGYDDLPRVQDRARRLVDTLEFIVRNGSADFYRVCQPILDHNYQRLCEMGGAWINTLDTILAHNLEQALK